MRLVFVATVVMMAAPPTSPMEQLDRSKISRVQFCERATAMEKAPLLPMPSLLARMRVESTLFVRRHSPIALPPSSYIPQSNRLSSIKELLLASTDAITVAP